MASTAGQSLPPLFVLQEHADPVLSCSFYPSEVYTREESDWFLSGDAGGLVVLWNLATRRPLVSFSAVAEAHRQLRSGSGGEAVFGAARAAVLGPHSRGVLSVGFLPLSIRPPPRAAHGRDAESGAGGQVAKTAVCSTVAERAASGGGGGGALPGRQRFRLPRRPPPTTTGTGLEETPSSSPQDTLTSVEPRCAAFSPSSTTCFYTHSRDQRVYVWCWQRRAPGASSAAHVVELVAVLTAPQHGFCPVESISTSSDGVARTYLAIPHELEGRVTVWEVAWRRPVADDAGPSTGQPGESPQRSANGSAVKDEEEEGDDVDTSNMNPMDALIARAASEERRLARQQLKSSSCSIGDVARSGDPTAGDGSPTPLVSASGSNSILCYVAPCAVTASSKLSIRRCCTFSACTSFKGGTIMRLTMCHDAQHLTVAFESGHVVLARYRDTEASGAAVTSPEGKRGAQGDVPAAPVRGVVRAFAESALVCWWSGWCMLACSSEGGMHCYDVVPGTEEGRLEVQLRWSVTLRKGIGSVFLQRNLVVAGCWDSTLRLYDARNGRLVSILSFQKETINEVRMAPSAIARAAAFGFDVRQPRQYAAAPRGSLPASTPHSASDAVGAAPRALATPQHSLGCGTVASCAAVVGGAAADPLREEEEEQLVYLFASVSKDRTVALWRVDLGVVLEQAVVDEGGRI
ncbi:WD domain, G-beta repeat [Novymonas esmeraldas]|uniref:WD domain, G-beta repeat n=1 Tax=Novymonas esmeraldas TaxID=1808958 RepID=A0AAW0F5S2_9TRYP